nr:vacuolar calcium ion transporter [Quercus suber]
MASVDQQSRTSQSRERPRSLNMHSIKRAAHRSAWRPDDDDDENKAWIPNPFGRVGRPRRARDEENTLAHTRSEGQIESPIEARRREDTEAAYEKYPAPQHHSTYPVAPNRNVQAAERGDLASSSEDRSKDSLENGKLNDDAARGLPPTESAEITDASVGANTSEGPRKRKLRKFLPFSKKQDEGEYVQRTETSESKKKKHPHLPVLGQIKVVFFSWVNILLVAVPVGFALNYALGDSRTDQIIIFVVNFIAIIPLAGMLSFATEELALYVGETLGGLLNASFGNAVELIVGVISLSQNQITIVQTSLVGSMLSNLLLVMGMCFFFGGLKRTEQFFNITVAQTAASLLALAIGSLVIPTAFAIFVQDQGVTASPDGTINGVSQASRGTAVMLLFIYACYLLFQLKTHVTMYNEPSQKVPKKKSGKKDPGEAMKGIAVMGAGTGAAASGGRINQDNLVHEAEEEEETPSLTMIGALVTLAGSTVLVAFCAEFMVSAIDAVSESGVSKEFVGLILLPIVGNAAEHATAVTVAIKDKMDLAIGVAVGSSLQIALLVLPLMVLLSWFGVGQDVLSLDFDGFQVSVLFIAIILVNYLIQDGKSHWLEGIMLNITYLIIALAAWFYPAPDDTRMANTGRAQVRTFSWVEPPKIKVELPVTAFREETILDRHSGPFSVCCLQSRGHKICFLFMYNCLRLKISYELDCNWIGGRAGVSRRSPIAESSRAFSLVLLSAADEKQASDPSRISFLCACISTCFPPSFLYL